MSFQEFAGLIIGMMVVTYLSRLFPLLVPKDLPLPAWLDRWLQLIPYAVLGALIFPGIISVDANRPWVGLAGGIAAALAAWKSGSIILTVLLAVLVVSILQ